MARDLEIRLQMNADGVVTAVEDADGSFKRVKATVESVGARLEKLEGDGQEAMSGVMRSSEGAAEAMDELSQRSIASAKSIEDLDQAVKSYRKAMVRATNPQDRAHFTKLAKRAQDARNEMVQMAGGADRATRSGGNFNQVWFTAGDAVQDFQYSGAAAANNLAQIAEMAAYTEGGMKAFVGSLIGMGGAVFALQVLMAYGPKLIAFFSDSAEEAERLQEQVEEIASDLVDLQAEIDSLSFSVSGEDNIRAYAENLGEATDKQRALVQALEQGAPQALSWKEQWGFASDVLAGSVPKLDKVNALVRELGVSPTLARQALGGMAEAQAELAQVIDKSNISLDQEARKLAGLSAESEAAQNKLAAIKVTQEAASAAMEAGANRAKDFVQAIGMSDDPLETAAEGLRKLMSMQESRGFSRMEQLAGEAQYLEGAISALREETDVPMDSPAVERLREQLAAANEEMEKLKASTKLTDQQKKELGLWEEHVQMQRDLAAAMRATDQAAREYFANQKRRRKELQEGSMGEMPSFSPSTSGGGTFDEAMGELGEILRMERLGRLTGGEAAAEQVRILNGALDELARAGKAGTTEYKILEETLQRSQSTLEDTGEAALSTMDIVGALGTAAFNALGSAIKNADSAAEGLKMTLSSVLQAAGQLMVQFGVSMGAAGAPLAIGGMGLSLVGGLFGGGRAEGGPVRSDDVYIVGERGPEMFVPETDGTVLPAHLTRSVQAAGMQRMGRELGELRRAVEAMQGAANTFTRRRPQAYVDGRGMQSALHQQSLDDQATFGNL